MDPVSTAIVSWLGEWATVAVAGSVLNGITTTVSSDEVTRSLKVATIVAQDSQRGYGLFSGCAPDGRKGIQKFLGQFAAIGQVQRELQKPLCEAGKPDVDVLVAAFRKQLGTKGNERIQGDCKLDFLEAWMGAFVDAYFGEIQGIRFQVAKEHYLKQLAARVDDVKFVGIAVAGEEVEKQEVLAQIFVMPDVREERSKTISRISSSDWIEGQTLLDEQKEWAMRDRSSPRIAAQTVLNQSKNKAVLLGAPGSGKTTLVSYFALMLTGDAGRIGLVGEDWLPVVVRIRDWILQPGMGLLEYLQWYAEKSLAVKGLPVGFFEHWLDRGKALILLDGLDEVVDEGLRRRVAEEIETFLHRYRENPAVITSRPAGYRWDLFNLDEFPHYTLEPFDEKQRDLFIDHWYDSRVADDAAKADRLKADLRKAFKGNDRIQKLAENPLLLTIIALIHRYQAELPRQRFKLYEKAVETLLTSWDSGKELKLYAVLQYLKPDDLLYVLKKLAYWIHAQGNAGDADGGTLIDKPELISQLCKEIRNLKGCKQHEAKQEAERFVDFVQRRTGLLNEQGRDRYAFVHKTFQEYLTAEEIYDRFEEGEDEVILDHIRDHLHDGHWREVLLLLVSKLKKKRAAKAIESVLNAGSEYEHWLHRDLLFAGWCLTEDPMDLKTAAPQLVGEILDRLVAIEIWDINRNGGKARREAAKIICRLGGTAFEGEMRERLNAQAGMIDRFRLIEFQASLGQKESSIALLLTFLEVNDFDVCCNVSESLIKLGNLSVEILNRLLILLSSRDDEGNVHYFAGKILIRLGNSSSEVVNGLLNLLNSEDSHVRCNAISWLGELGNSSSEVVNRLRNLLEDDDSSVSSCVAGSLVQLGSSSSEVINRLLRFLEDDHPILRSNAVESLAKLGNPSSEIVNCLLKLLKDDESYVRSSTAESLGRLGNSSPEVVNGLLRLLEDNKYLVRSSAAGSLGRLGNSSPEVVNGLLRLLEDNESLVRSSAAGSLGQLGNSSPEVVNSLLRLLKDDESCVRSSAAGALGQLGPLSLEVANGLLSLLIDNKFNAYYCAARSLSQLTKKPEIIFSAVMQWIEQEQHADDAPIGEAIDVLWAIVVE